MKVKSSSLMIVFSGYFSSSSSSSSESSSLTGAAAFVAGFGVVGLACLPAALPFGVFGSLVGDLDEPAMSVASIDSEMSCGVEWAMYCTSLCVWSPLVVDPPLSMITPVSKNRREALLGSLTRWELKFM